MTEGKAICPLLTANTVLGANENKQTEGQPVSCAKERCAWWVEDKQKCAITAIGGKK